MHIAQNYGPPLLPANPFSSPDPWTANLSTCSPFIVAPQADMCPNNPWSTVSLPVFENQWVPHPQSHLINVMPGLQHCSDIHREFAIYMPRWFHPELGTELLCGGLFLFPIQRGALRRLLYGHSRHWFACGFKLKYAFTSQIVLTSNTLYLLGFLLPQRLSFSAYPLIKTPPSSRRSPPINPVRCDLSSFPETPYYFIPEVDKFFSYKGTENKYFRFCWLCGSQFQQLNSTFVGSSQS